MNSTVQILSDFFFFFFFLLCEMYDFLKTPISAFLILSWIPDTWTFPDKSDSIKLLLGFPGDTHLPMQET